MRFDEVSGSSDPKEYNNLNEGLLSLLSKWLLKSARKLDPHNQQIVKKLAMHDEEWAAIARRKQATATNKKIRKNQTADQKSADVTQTADIEQMKHAKQLDLVDNPPTKQIKVAQPLPKQHNLKFGNGNGNNKAKQITTKIAAATAAAAAVNGLMNMNSKDGENK
jgi:hypothetical protein